VNQKCSTEWWCMVSIEKFVMDSCEQTISVAYFEVC
jgi:hypothetical protein